MKRWRQMLAMVAACAAAPASPAFASGDPIPSPTYIDDDHTVPAEAASLYSGRLGMVLARSPQPQLFMAWRLLHGMPVGAEVGPTLIEDCCTAPADAPGKGTNAWLAARVLVPGAAEAPSYLPTEMSWAPYQYVPNCYADAFDTAAATLRDRIARHGAADPSVAAWLAAQDAVFGGCSGNGATLPALATDAPGWLRADRAYQEAALALYSQQYLDAAGRFTAIARDKGSPWQKLGLYLRSRALYREAMDHPDPVRFLIARTALYVLAAEPAGTYGRERAGLMLNALAFRDMPEKLLPQLDHELMAATLPLGTAERVRDYLELSDGLTDEKAASRPDAADWILTLHQWAPDRAQPYAHALARWKASHDTAWLLAALALSEAQDPDAPALAAAADGIGPKDPAWLTAQYHAIRLTIAKTEPGTTRARVDDILARTDLTQSERNLFSGVRVQLATDLADFARHALRRPFCASGKTDTCVSPDFAESDATLGRSPQGFLGLGEEARALIDRMPLDARIALGRNPAIPVQLRLDLALTSFARAAMLQDDKALTATAGDLVTLLPQMQADWRRIVATAPGPDRRFAAYFAMAKIPSLRSDLSDYARPEGETVRQFPGNWTDWMIVPPGQKGTPDYPSGYQSDGIYAYGSDKPEDLTCRTKCGGGIFALTLPPFMAARKAESDGEVLRLRSYDSSLYPPEHPSPVPAGSVSAWEEMFAWARAHPQDPRSPEALYWLIRIARWGANHDHIGKRAFPLLHGRYAGSVWAKKAPFYYDDGADGRN